MAVRCQMCGDMVRDRRRGTASGHQEEFQCSVCRNELYSRMDSHKCIACGERPADNDYMCGTCGAMDDPPYVGYQGGA